MESLGKESQRSTREIATTRGNRFRQTRVGLDIGNGFGGYIVCDVVKGMHHDAVGEISIACRCFRMVEVAKGMRSGVVGLVFNNIIIILITPYYY